MSTDTVAGLVFCAGFLMWCGAGITGWANPTTRMVWLMATGGSLIYAWGEHVNGG